MISGSIVAIITPMLDDGCIDYPAFARLIDFHHQAGTDAIVVAGTTGESATLSVDEQSQLIAFAVKHSNGKITIIAGTGANSTEEAIHLSQLAKDAGADATLSVVPYYNKPTQEGLYQHFQAIAAAVDIPLILYNVPGRTVADMNNDTILRLAQISNIVGVKDATGKLDIASDLIARAPQGFALLSGDDLSSCATLLLGFHGTISVTANIAPAAIKKMCSAATAGDLATARKIHFSLLALNRDLFCEANPIPVKWAASELGLTDANLRLPLTTLSTIYHSRVKEAMHSAGLI